MIFHKIYVQTLVKYQLNVCLLIVAVTTCFFKNGAFSCDESMPRKIHTSSSLVYITIFWMNVYYYSSILTLIMKIDYLSLFQGG